MRRGKLLLIVSCLIAAATLMASCSPAAISTPTPKAAAAPQKAETVAARPSEAPGAPSPSPKPAAEQPKYGGVLTMVVQGDVQSLDVQRQNTLALFGAVGPAYSGILQYDPVENEKIVSDLAARWESSADGATFTFYFNKGVTWHDGKPFTSLDAKFSFERLEEFSGLKAFVKGIKAIETPDSDTLRLRLERPIAAFPSMIAHGRVVMVPKHVVDAKRNLDRDVVGTGPFKLQEYVTGLGYKLTKNPDYFVKGRPYLDGITSFVISDLSTRRAAFRAGRVKMIGMPPDQPLTLSEADITRKTMPQASVQPFRCLNGWGITLNTTRPPWNDIRLRRAAFLVIDRQKALEVVGEGIGELSPTLIFGEWAIPQAELLKTPGFRQPKDQDIAEAKRLLAEAGYDKGFKSSVLVRAGFAMYEKIATYSKDQLAKLGIDLQLEIVDRAIYLDRRNRLAFEAITQLDPLSIADPEVSDRNITLKGGGIFSTLDDERTLDLYDKQAAATNISDRKKLILDIQYRTMEVVPHLFLFWGNGFLAMDQDVRGYKPGVGTHNNYRLQDVWLAG